MEWRGRPLVIRCDSGSESNCSRFGTPHEVGLPHAELSASPRRKWNAKNAQPRTVRRLLLVVESSNRGGRHAAALRECAHCVELDLSYEAQCQSPRIYSNSPAT
jgi:hypothetical protein